MISRIKSIYIYHVVIWAFLIIFKLIMDYSIFGSFLLSENLRIFCISALIFYLNYALLLPFLVKQKRAVVVMFIAISVLAYFILMVVSGPPGPRPAMNPEMMQRMRAPQHFPQHRMRHREGGMMLMHDIIFKLGFFAICFSTLLFFADKWAENRKTIRQLEFERQSGELKILREQINPHFFFNALNSIYSLSISKSPDTPRVVLILSDIMRYVLNNKNGRKNNLEEEILNIKKYIEIQSIRFRKFNNIHCEFSGDFSQYEIEPLLLLTFVENAFKYADFQKGPLEILILAEGGMLHFDIQNCYKKKINEEDGNKLGIKNTKQKLDLLYPGLYTLNITDSGSHYHINLQLNLNSK